MNRHELLLQKIRDLVVEAYKEDNVYEVLMTLGIEESKSILIINNFKKNEEGNLYIVDNDVAREQKRYVIKHNIVDDVKEV